MAQTARLSHFARSWNAPLLLVLASGAAGLAACDTPDPETAYNDFLARTEDLRAGDVALGEGVDEDFSGTYFLAASTVLNPLKMIHFSAEVIVDGDTIDFVFQPLVADYDEDDNLRPDRRTPAGDPIIVDDVPFVNGTFAADLGVINIDGEANPITLGADITAELSLSGVVESTEFFCGAVTGGVLAPITFPLDGSTFAAQKTDDFLAATPIGECLSDESEEPADEPADAGTPDATDTGADVPSDVTPDVAPDTATDAPTDSLDAQTDAQGEVADTAETTDAAETDGVDL